MGPAWQVGARQVLVMTCVKCGLLRPGAAFRRFPRKPGERAYIDRRCGSCLWAHLVRGEGHSGTRLEAPL